MSQDPLEHFFGLVRVRFGSNNNPTPYQFKSVYKRLLIGISDKLVKYGNVNLLDSDNLIALIPTAEDRINYVLEYCVCDEFEFDDVSRFVKEGLLRAKIFYNPLCPSVFNESFSVQQIKEHFLKLLSN